MDIFRILSVGFACCIFVLKAQPLDFQVISVTKLSENVQKIMESQQQTLKNSEILKYSPYTLPKNFYPAHKCGNKGTLLTLITSFNDNFDYLNDVENKKSVYSIYSSIVARSQLPNICNVLVRNPANSDRTHDLIHLAEQLGWDVLMGSAVNYRGRMYIHEFKTIMINYEEDETRSSAFIGYANVDIFFTDSLSKTLRKIDLKYKNYTSGPISITGVRLNMIISNTIFHERSFGDPIDVEKILPSLCQPANSTVPPASHDDYPRYSHTTSADYWIYKHAKLVDWQNYANVAFGFFKVDSHLIAQGMNQKNSLAIDTTRSVLAFHDSEDLSFKSEQYRTKVNENILTEFFNSSDNGVWYGGRRGWVNVNVASRKVKSWFTTGDESEILVSDKDYDGFEYTERPAWKCEQKSVVWGEGKVEGEVSKSSTVPPKTTTTESKNDTTTNNSQINPPSQNCDISFAPPNTFSKPVALVSTPGAGNTWTRHLIEAATGVFTGSLYHDPSLFKGGMLGEHAAILGGEALTIKAHFGKYAAPHEKNCTDLTTNLAGCIFVVRNPRDAILSQMNFEMSHSHTKKMDLPEIARTQNAKVKGIYTRLIEWWTYSYSSFKPFCTKENTLTIFYEDLKSETFEETKKMIDFLKKVYGKDETTGADKVEFRDECLKLNQDGSFHRKHNEDPDFSWILKNELVTEKDFGRLDQKFVKWKTLFPDITLPEGYRFY